MLQRLYDNEQLSADNLEAGGAGSMSCWGLLDLPSEQHSGSEQEKEHKEKKKKDT